MGFALRVGLLGGPAAGSGFQPGTVGQEVIGFVPGDAATGGTSDEIPAELLKRAFADFIPATSPLERELQILAAVQECTSREILPPRYRDQGREDIVRRLRAEVP